MKLKKVIHVTVGKVNPNGENGINRVVYNLNKNEKITGLESEIWSFSSDVKSETSYVRDEFVEVTLFPFMMPWRQQFLKKIRTSDLTGCIFHFHTPWIKEKFFATRLLRKIGVPYVVSLHGLYYESFLKSLKKFFAFQLYEKSIINKSAGIRTITHEEKFNARKIGLTCPTFVLPNGIEQLDLHNHSNKNESASKNQINICWVGVLRDYKNIDKLIYSTQYIPSELLEKIRFKIIGPDHAGNLEKYRELARHLNVLDHFNFTGPLYGAEKFKGILSSDLYIMPSEIDEISLAVLDAMACAKPIIATRQCHLTYYMAHDFLEMCEPFPEDISDAIVRMIKRRQDWHEMGVRAKALAETQFSWNTIAKQIIKFYDKVLSRTEYASKKSVSPDV